MSENILNFKSRGSKEFIKIMEYAVAERADSVNLEYADTGLEVCYMFGNIGIGEVLVSRELEDEVIGYIVESANLHERTRGKFRVNLRGEEYIINVKEYDHFAESAFELTFKKTNR